MRKGSLRMVWFESVNNNSYFVIIGGICFVHIFVFMTHKKLKGEIKSSRECTPNIQYLSKDSKRMTKLKVKGSFAKMY